MASKKEQIHALLKGIETGDSASVAVVNEARYIQHNPQTHEGSIGLAELFKQLSKTSPRVNIVRIFEDGDYVFGHTEYDFAERNIGFEVFRFEDGQTVEHWDNIQRRKGPNPSGHSMVDGATEVIDHDKTETNRTHVRAFVEQVLINREHDTLSRYISEETFIEHNPHLTDGMTALHAALMDDRTFPHYAKVHRVLAEGNFVLAVSEGTVQGKQTALYDLFRLKAGKIVEHWDTVETIPPRSEWKNDNGKF